MSEKIEITITIDPDNPEHEGITPAMRQWLNKAQKQIANREPQEIENWEEDLIYTLGHLAASQYTLDNEPKPLGLYKFSQYCGRPGTLEGIFVARKDKVKDAIGKEIYYGEVLGKHSDVRRRLTSDDITLLSDDPEFIKRVQEIFRWQFCLSGINPIAYLEDMEEMED